LDEIHAKQPLDAILVTGGMTDAGRSAEWAEFFEAFALSAARRIFDRAPWQPRR
jgi:hypothetical protein